MISIPDPVRLAADLAISWESVPIHFASRGYAVMQVDFRGTGCSERSDPYPFNPQERQDGHDARAATAIRGS